MNEDTTSNSDQKSDDGFNQSFWLEKKIFYNFSSAIWNVASSDLRRIAQMPIVITCKEKSAIQFKLNIEGEEKEGWGEREQITAEDYYKKQLRTNYSIQDNQLLSLIMMLLFDHSGGLLAETDKALSFLYHPTRTTENQKTVCSLLPTGSTIEMSIIEDAPGQYTLTYKKPLTFCNAYEAGFSPSHSAKAPIGNVEVSISITKNADTQQFDLALKTFYIDLTLDAEKRNLAKVIAFWKECGAKWKEHITEKGTQTIEIYDQCAKIDIAIDNAINTIIQTIPDEAEDRKDSIQSTINLHKLTLKQNLLKAAHDELTHPKPQDEKQKEAQQTRLEAAVKTARREFCAAVFKDRNKLVAFTRPAFSFLATAFIGICTAGIAPAINKYYNDTWFFCNRTKTGKAYREQHKQFVPAMQTILTH